MSREEKVARVKRARERFGLAAALEVLELSRSTWYYHGRRGRSYEEKYEHLRKPLEAIAQAHSEYGYRRTAVELREVHGWPVNRKVVQRLHRLWDLPLLRGTRRPKPSGVRRAIQAAGARVNKRAQKAEIGPFDMFYTDFTELVYAAGRTKAQLIPILDHTTKLALGWAVGERAVTIFPPSERR